MTQESITIDEIIKLDSERTSGEWEAFGSYVELGDGADISGKNTYAEENVAFIAAAPRIAAKAIELDQAYKELHETLVIISRDMNMWAKSYAEEKARTIELSKKLKDMTDIAFDKSTELERLKLLLKGQQK